MKKVLIIEESSLLRDFYRTQLVEHGFDVVVAVNGLDGIAKLRNDVPDLVVMDYSLSRASAEDVLQRKMEDPNVKTAPVIVVSKPLDKDSVLKLAKYQVKKFFNKPVKFDQLLETIGALLDEPVRIDTTPCMIEAHVNDHVLFIEIAQGLNREKIALLRYRIQELLDLYRVRIPRVLLMMASVEVGDDESDKLEALFRSVLDVTDVKPKFVKILTRSKTVESFLRSHTEFEALEVTDSIEQAMDGLFARKAGSYLEKGSGRAQEEVLASGNPKNKKNTDDAIDMRFGTEGLAAETGRQSSPKIAVVDDDSIIQELVRTAFEDTGAEVVTYDDGADFLDDSSALTSDLVFLDLMMPKKDGFTVLDELRTKETKPPVIILSALSQRDSVIRAMKFGVTSYLIKPLKPENVLRKAAEVLNSNF